MTSFQEALCHCPICHGEATRGSSLIEVSQYQNARGEWVRWTRCSLCHSTARQVYLYDEHRFGAPTLINRSVV